MSAFREDLALKIINASKAEIYLRLRFFHIALGFLKFPSSTVIVDNQKGFATDGETVFFNADWLISAYKKNKPMINRSIIHLLLHCLYKHPFNLFTQSFLQHYDLACDIIVESIIDDMSLAFMERPNQSDRELIYKKIKEESVSSTLIISEVTSHLNSLKPTRIIEYKLLFQSDDHQYWKNKNFSKAPTNEPNQDSESSNDSSNEALEDPSKKSISEIQGVTQGRKSEELLNIWEDLGSQLKLDLETFNQEAGFDKGALHNQLNIVYRKKYDYKDALSKFLEIKEIYREDLDTFDPIYYLYGLNELGNRPLIEYAEYKEVPVLNELAIIIDTSGSTYHDMVMKFLELTYSIILSTTTQNQNFKVYIIQVDTEVQEVKEITSMDDFTAYMENFDLKGGGGTDFKPGFAYVQKLIEEDNVSRIKGLIYFTDGYGDFPETSPGFESLIVFHESSYTDQYVPLWASRIVINEEDLNEYSRS